MPVAHKGAISFGLVHIPVSLYTATQDNDISFNQLHKADQSRIKYKKVCTHCGKEITKDDIVRGFQYEKDKYVIITDEEIEKIKTEKDKTIQILQFSNLSEISPVYYDKAYYVAPEKGGEKALELLRLAMMNTQKVALGRSVFGNNEKLLIMIPRENGILVTTLLYDDDVRELPALTSTAAPSKAELSMAEKLIESMGEKFDASAFKDTFRDKLKELIADKIAGREIKSAKEKKPGKIIDLMEALKASVESGAGAKKPSAKKAAAKKTTAQNVRKKA